MEKIIVLIYEILGKFLRIVAELPYIIQTDSRIINWGFTSLIFLTGLLLLFVGCSGDKGYKMPIKHTIGFLWCGVVAFFTGMLCQNTNMKELLNRNLKLGIGGLMLLLLLVQAEEIIRGKGNGIRTFCLWMGEFFLAALGMRIWIQKLSADNMAGYKRLFRTIAIPEKFHGFLKAHSFSNIDKIVEWILVLVLLAMAAVLMAQAGKVLGGIYKHLSASLLVANLMIMIVLCHEGTTWKNYNALIVYLIMAAAQLSFVFLLIYALENAVVTFKPDDKGKNKLISVVFTKTGAVIRVMIAGMIWNLAAIFCVDLAQNGAMKRLVKPISDMMTWFYNRLSKMEFGYHTNFLNSTQRAYLGILAAVLFTSMVTLLFFLILKVFLGNLQYDGLTLIWLRNSILVFAVPLAVYWFYTMCTKYLGDTGVWLEVLLRALSATGLCICLGNLIPAFRKKGFLSLARWTVAGLLVCLLFNGLLLPVLMSFA